MEEQEPSTFQWIFWNVLLGASGDESKELLSGEKEEPTGNWGNVLLTLVTTSQALGDWTYVQRLVEDSTGKELTRRTF